jgi:hypothetical protein
MCPPLIYPQLPHLHNHGLAISSHAIWKEFSKVVFLLRYHQNPQVLKETEHRKKREKKVLKKEREKEKLQEYLQVKRGSQYFERRQTFQLQNLFTWVHFLPLHHTISKTLSKIIWEKFAALFGPFFNLAIYMTWVLSVVFTHELHIFSLYRVGWKRNIC